MNKVDKATLDNSYTNIKPIKPIKPITSKTDRTSLGHGSMRLVHRRNNPNKETLIDIPLSHVTVILAHTT